MNKSPIAPLAYLCVILSGTLGFLIQPLMGKKLVPFFGGAPASWVGSLLFFQTALLLGYIWAFWLLKKPLKTQVYASGSLAIIALLTLQNPETLPHPNPRGWLSRNNQKIPYKVYAVSNLGSLTGLLSYTFFLEPNHPIATHTQIWTILTLICFGLITLVGILTLITPPKNNTSNPEGESDDSHRKTTPLQVLYWVSLSALACSQMIAATYLISGEIGSNPASWVAPFGLYLLAFSLSFSGIIKNNLLKGLSILALASFSLWLAAPPQEKVFGPGLLLTVFSTCLIILTKLYHSQPPKDYKRFLLSLAVGGSLGGLASSFVIPFVFPKANEFFYLSILSLAIGLTSITKKPLYSAAVIAVVFLLPDLPKYYHNLKAGPFPIYLRDTLGSLKVTLNESTLAIHSLTTTHGTQNTKTPKVPTSYYSKHSPPGLYLSSQTKPLRVGVIGLSTGTLAAYAKPGDSYTFWDIDPKVIPLSQNLFEYLKDNPGQIQIQISDGRLSLKNSDEDFDALIIDAYSGDAIPPHLLTQEAFQIYKDRLQKNNGVLFIHHSTRYSDYRTPLTNTAQSVGMQIQTLITTPEQLDPGSSPSVYSILTTQKNAKTLIPLTENTHRDITQPPTDSPIWTDEFNSSLHTLNKTSVLKKLLTF